MNTPAATREPCPDRILDDIGGAFGMGALGGGAFHFLKGLRNSPTGERLRGGATAVRMNAPRVGGGFAIWGGLFSLFDCSLVFLRRKEDPYNAVIAGAATGGLLAARRGPLVAARSALVGGALLALVEGAGIVVNRFMAAQQEKNMPVFVDVGQEPELPATPSSWFGGWGRKKEEGGEAKDVVLESFNSPVPPTFEFK